MHPAAWPSADHGAVMAAMCISLGDFNNDGWLDLYISDFQRSSDHVWQNDGKGFLRRDQRPVAGITRATHDVLSFGGGFFRLRQRRLARYLSSPTATYIPKSSRPRRVLITSSSTPSFTTSTTASLWK